MEYTLQHACFSCRKSFKKLVPGKLEGTHRDYYILTPGNQVKYKCPDCGNSLFPMGKNFKAPRMSLVEEWKVIEILYQNGFRFISGHGPQLPTRMRDLKTFLIENQEHPLKVIKENKSV